MQHVIGTFMYIPRNYRDFFGLLLWSALQNNVAARCPNGRCYRGSKPESWGNHCAHQLTSSPASYTFAFLPLHLQIPSDCACHRKIGKQSDGRLRKSDNRECSLLSLLSRLSSSPSDNAWHRETSRVLRLDNLRKRQAAFISEVRFPVSAYSFCTDTGSNKTQATTESSMVFLRLARSLTKKPPHIARRLLRPLLSILHVHCVFHCVWTCTQEISKEQTIEYVGV